MTIQTLKRPRLKISKGADIAVLVYMDELSVKLVKIPSEMRKRLHDHADDLANGTYTDCYDDLEWLQEHGEPVIDLEDAVAIAVV